MNLLLVRISVRKLGRNCICYVLFVKFYFKSPQFQHLRLLFDLVASFRLLNFSIFTNTQIMCNSIGEKFVLKYTSVFG